MSTVDPGSQEGVALPMGSLLTVTAGAGGSAICLENAGNTPQITLASGQTRTFGPFPWDRVIGISALTVGATYSVSAAASAGLDVTHDLASSANDLDPGSGWPANYDRLVLTASGGSCNLTGLKAGTDGQTIVLANEDATATITLKNASSSSAAANRFRCPGGADFSLAPLVSVELMYWGGSDNVWAVTP